MHSFSDDLLFTTVRLEGQFANGALSVGTGFYYASSGRYFLVTNKHVINGVKNGTFIINKGNGKGQDWMPTIGGGYRVEFNDNSFFGHPNPEIDVAIMNITYYINKINEKGEVPFFMSVTADSIPTQEDIDKNVRAIEDILFVGYPNGIWDSTNLLPIVRKGITATPYYYDFKGEPKFLIDASVFPGSSGSPVYIYNSGFYIDKRGVTINKSRFLFLGIIAMTFHRQEEGTIIIKDIPTSNIPIAITNQMIDLGIVFKASTVQECVKYFTEKHN